MRIRSSRRGYWSETCDWKLYPLTQPAAPGVAEQALGTFGLGKSASRATPGAYRRFAGMMLPGNGAFELGSRIVNGLPLLSTLCEKFPARSRSVGTVML